MQKGIDSNKEVYERDWSSYDGFTVQKINADNKFIMAFNQTTAAQLMGYSTVEDSREAFNDAYTEMLPKLAEAFDKFKEACGNAFKVMGEKLDEWGPKLPGEIEKLTDEINKVGAAYADWAEKAKSGITAMLDELGKQEH